MKREKTNYDPAKVFLVVVVLGGIIAGLVIQPMMKGEKQRQEIEDRRAKRAAELVEKQLSELRRDQRR